MLGTRLWYLIHDMRKFDNKIHQNNDGKPNVGNKNETQCNNDNKINSLPTGVKNSAGSAPDEKSKSQTGLYTIGEIGEIPEINVTDLKGNLQYFAKDCYPQFYVQRVI